MDCLAVATSRSFEHQSSSHGVPIVAVSLQTKGDRVVSTRGIVAQETQLWRVPVLQNKVQIPVLVQVKGSKGATIFWKIQTAYSRHI